MRRQIAIALRRIMKRALAIILAVFYLGISTGATIHMHYCMGKLVDWGLWHSKSEQCSNCGMSTASTQANHCCTDEHQFVKLEKDQQAGEILLQPAPLAVVALPPAPVNIAHILLSTLPEWRPVNHAPPPSPHKAIYLLNCVFRI